MYYIVEWDAQWYGSVGSVRLRCEIELARGEVAGLLGYGLKR
jgi:hypothetical protein